VSADESYWAEPIRILEPLIRRAPRATFCRKGRREMNNDHALNPLISPSILFTAPASKLATG
jgi:hypothetical protein